MKAKQRLTVFITPEQRVMVMSRDTSVQHDLRYIGVTEVHDRVNRYQLILFYPYLFTVFLTYLYYPYINCVCK